jgi:glycosyltransferase involved in cell wall biosynthesis
MPVFNGERYLPRANESLLAQDFTDFELIICDNASSDSTPAICRDYADRDPRVRVHRNRENIGAIPNHNRVFGLATGEFFKWAACDDEHVPEMLGKCVSTIRSAPSSVVLVYPQAELIDESGFVLSVYRKSIECRGGSAAARLSKVIACIRLGTPIYGVFRSDALRKTRLHAPFRSSDYVLLAEMALLGEIWEVPEPLLRKRLHSERSTAVCVDDRSWQGWALSSGRSVPRLMYAADRVDLEYMRAVIRSTLPLKSKAECLRTVLKSSQTQTARLSRWKRRLGLAAER